MNTIKSKLLTFLIVIFIIGFLQFLYLQNPKLINNINNNLIDSAFIYRGIESADDRIVIIDIDEKSLQTLGQWPWSRNKVAQIIDNLTDAEVGIIGLDVVFAEADRSSPSLIAKELNLSVESLPNFDKILARSLENSPTITGFTFNFEQTIESEAPAVNAIFIEKGKGENEALFEAKGITTNIEILQQSAYSSASFNTVPDSDGVIRYSPLLFSYDGSIYPSLSFEMVRVMLGVKMVDVNYDENGVSSIKLDELVIPTDEFGRLFVNYRGAGKSYRYISALDIYNNNFDKEYIKGAITLLGASAAGLLDLRATPYDHVFPGVEVHANIIDNIINNNLISSPSYTKGVTIISIFLTVLIISLIISFATPLLSFGLIVGFLGLQAGFYYSMFFEDKLLLNFAYPLIASLMTVFILTFVKVYQENRQKEMISDKFSKKVSPQVAAKLLKNSKDVFSASQMEVTIFFSDIRNFTTISENFDNPKILIDYLNTYMSPMSQIIIEHEGTIDKYIGDAIMAYWNAPMPVKNHADKAVSAAIKQIDALEKLNKELKEKKYPPIEIGIGLHTGEAIVGEMGSEGRSDYTAIGDSINLGSRIEGLCKPYGVKILISQQTKEKLTKKYKLREVDEVQVKGKEESVMLHQVLGFGEFSKDEMEVENLYKDAKSLYKDAKFKEAYELFFKAFEKESAKIFALYMDRCAQYQDKNIKEFDSVYKFTTK
jgi:adenylate cyclase